MQEAERLGCGRKHLGSLSRAERPQRQNLRQIFIRTFHDNIQKPRAFNLTASTFEQLNQVRVGEFCNALPERQLSISVQALRGYQLNGGLTRSPGALGEKNNAVFRTAQPLPQRKFFVDDFPYPIFPYFFPRPLGLRTRTTLS